MNQFSLFRLVFDKFWLDRLRIRMFDNIHRPADSSVYQIFSSLLLYLRERERATMNQFNLINLIAAKLKTYSIIYNITCLRASQIYPGVKIRLNCLTNLSLKNHTFILLIFISSILNAKEYNFNYKFNQESLKISINSSTWNDAYETAANKCMDFYLKDIKKASEDRFMDILDVCVNPR